MSELVVHLSGRRVARVLREGDRLRLDYDTGAADLNLPPLAPCLPMVASSPKSTGGVRRHSDRVEAFLAGLVPENPDTLQEWADRLGTSPSPFDVLGGMGLDCAGAVQFATPETEHLLASTGSWEPVADAEIEARLARLADDDAQWSWAGEHWSLAGQQGKFALSSRAGVWNSAHGAAATTHIFKPGIRRLKHQALVEHVTTRAATALGLAVALTEFAQFGDQVALISRRFDRRETDDGIERLHQVDLCQALGLPPAQKYESRGGPTAVAIAQLIRENSTAAREDVIRFSDSLLFNYVTGSPDGHAKNYSLLYAGTQVRLAPLYDLSSALAYSREDEAGPAQVAIAIGGRRGLRDVDREGWLNHARQMALEPDERLTRLETLCSAAPGAFETAIDEVRRMPGAAEIRARLLPALTEHIRSVAARAGISAATPHTTPPR